MVGFYNWNGVCLLRGTFYILRSALTLYYVFCVDLRTNSDYYTVHHWLVGFYNWDGVCLLRGTLYILRFAHTFYYVMCVHLRTNSDYFTVQHWLVGFYNWDGVCLLRGTFYILRSAHALYLCVLCGSENKHLLFHCTTVPAFRTEMDSVCCSVRTESLIDVSFHLWVVKIVHRFTVLLCRDVARTVRPLGSHLQLCTYDLPCHACYIYRSTSFILSSCLTGQLMKSCVSLLCPKTLPEVTWSRDLNSSKHSSILFLVPLSHSITSVILCTPLKCCYINVAYIGSSLVNWAFSFAPGVYVYVCVCVCVFMFVCLCVCMCVRVSPIKH